MRTYVLHAVVPVPPVAVVISVLFCNSISRQKRRESVAVLAVPAFHVFVAAAVAAVFVAFDMFALVLCHVFPSGDSTVTATAWPSGRSPQGEGQSVGMNPFLRDTL